MLKTKILGNFFEGAYVYVLINNSYVLCSIISVIYKIIKTPDGKKWLFIEINNKQKLFFIGV